MCISAPAAVFVARVAGGGAVAVTPYALVGVVGLRLLVRCRRMAVDAGEARVVRGDLVAIVADRPVVGNRKVRVIKDRAQPARSAVTRVASRWVPGGDMVGNRTTKGLRAVPLRHVATVTSRVRRGQRVIVTDVAVRAGLNAAWRRHHVAARQSPARGAVIELSVGP